MTHPVSASRASMRKRLLIAAASVSLAAAVPATALPPGGAATRPNGATVKLSTLKVKAGGTIKVTGANWKSQGSRVYTNSKVPVVSVKLSDRDIIGVFPIRNKKFSGTIRIDKRVKPGRYWLRFLAAKPATSVKSQYIQVLPAGPTPRVTTTAKTVKAGARVRIVGTNWTAPATRTVNRKRVQYVTVRLSGRTVIARLTVKNKRFVGNVTIPRNTRPGNYFVQATGRTSKDTARTATIRVVK